MSKYTRIELNQVNHYDFKISHLYLLTSTITNTFTAAQKCCLVESTDTSSKKQPHKVNVSKNTYLYFFTELHPTIACQSD